MGKTVGGEFMELAKLRPVLTEAKGERSIRENLEQRYCHDVEIKIAMAQFQGTLFTLCLCA